MGGPEMAPHTPRRSGRPGEPGSPLDPASADGRARHGRHCDGGPRDGLPDPPDARGDPGNPGRPSTLRPLMDGPDMAAIVMGGPETASRTPPTLGATRETRGAPRPCVR